MKNKKKLLEPVDSNSFLLLFILNELLYILMIAHKMVFEGVVFDMDNAVCNSIHKFCIVAGEKDISFERNKAVVYSDDGL